MNILILKEKEKQLKTYQAEYSKELASWKDRAKEISLYLNSLKNSIKINDGRYIIVDTFGYHHEDRILLNVYHEFVSVEILDFENDKMGYAEIKIEDFVSDDWKLRLEKEITILKNKENKEKNKAKKEKEFAEYQRLKAKYKNS